MAAQSDANPLPEKGSEAYFALAGMLVQAVMHGELATLERAGAAAIAHVNVEPLKLAVDARQPHVVAWAVEESARTGIDIASGWTAVQVAAYQGDMGKLRAASDEDLSLLTDRDGETVLHVAALGDQAEAIEYLVRERGVDVHVADRFGRRSLETASMRGCLSAIDALVACGARLHDDPRKASKALMRAAGYGQVDAMEKLVDLGADVTVANAWSGVLNSAAAAGSLDAINCAVRLGVDPRAVPAGRGMTALHAAALEGQPGVMVRLVQLGVPIDMCCGGGTALHSSMYSPDACRTLLELGADRWIKDAHGHTARDAACAASQLDQEAPDAVLKLLDTYFPIVPCMAALLLGLRGPSESPLTRLAAHSAFEPKVLSLVNCLLTGKDDKAFAQLVSES